MHPSESDLALYAGGELGLWARFRIGRHLSRCRECSHQVEEFRDIRDWVRGTGDELPPELDWGMLAGDMKANIRLGLAAGQCVASSVEAPGFRWRAAAMALPVLLVVIVGWLLQSWPVPLHPVSRTAVLASGTVLEADPNGIALRANGRTFTLLHPRGADITFSVSGPGTLRTRYVDSETGYVTISHVYDQ